MKSKRAFPKGTFLTVFLILCVITALSGTEAYLHVGNALASPLPDTGQTKCYNNSAEITCPQPGEDFYGQDGNYLINPPSYTKLDASGNDLPDSATSWVMVRDNVTGLIWEVKTDDGSIHDKENRYSWQDAQDMFISQVNDSSFGGNSDWRLPTVRELASISNLGRFTPAIDTEFFPNIGSSCFSPATGSSSGYWSSTATSSHPLNAWYVHFGYGYVVMEDNTNNSYVRCVRAGPSGSLDSLIINGDGTVTDSSTGLMWQQDTASAGTYTWEEGFSYSESLTLAGYDDWRLPNQRELQSIVDYGTFNAAIDTAFSNTNSSDYLSSSTRASGPDWAWLVYFSYGQVGFHTKVLSHYDVRCVRGGQIRLLDYLVILTPAQASSWYTGDSMAISWETQSIAGNVKISISRQGGKDGTFETIAASTANDGSYNWTVTGSASVNCVLKIEPLSDTSKGTSQGLFTLYGPPTVTTKAISSITSNSASSGGTVTFDGGADVTARGVCWSTSANPTISNSHTTDGTGTGSFTSSITGLSPGTTYHVRAYAINSEGTSYGSDQTFITSTISPTVTTTAVSNINSTTATSGGNVTFDGGASVTARGVCWSTSANPTISNSHTTNGTGIGSFTSNITGLNPGTTYHVRAYATNSAGTNYGSDISFVTPPVAPTATTGSASPVTSSSATLNGTVNPNGASTTVIFEYGASTSYGNTVTAAQSPLNGATAQSVSAGISSLTPGTTYHFRVKATNSVGTSYGEDQMFTTSALAPTVTTGTATSVTSTSATLNGTVNPNGISTTYFFQYGTTTSYSSTTTSTSAGSGTNDISVNASLTGLTSNTTYHFRLVATNSAGTSYGDDHTFITLAPKPTLSIGLGAGTRGETITLPITLSNVTGADIAAVSVDIGYDMSFFEKPKATIGPAGDAADKTISTSELSFGVFRVTVFSISNNNVIGDGVVAYLTLDILSNAPGSSTKLANTPSASDPSGNDVTVEGADGTVTLLGYLAGDCNSDGTVSIAEVQSAINMALGITPVEDCVDVNGNGRVSIGEVQKVINNHLELSPTDYTAFPRDNTDNIDNPRGGIRADIMSGQIKVRAGNTVPTLTISRTTGEPGETVTVSVSLTNASGYQISALLTNISYDTNVLENPTVVTGPAGTAIGKTVTSSEPSSGIFRIGVLSVSNNSAIGNGVVAYLTFTVKTGASLGVATLQNSPEASDPSGNDVPLEGTNGSISAATVIYVEPNGQCGGNSPCFFTIQDGIDSADTYSVIKVSQGTYEEDISIDEGNNVTIQGGWNSTFTSRASTTTVTSLTVGSSGGTVIAEYLVIQ